MKVFFWQNTPSHIQTGALEEFARLWPDEVTGVWCENLYPIRKDMGWKVLPSRHLKNIYLSAKGWREEVLQIVSQNTQAIHILSAIGAYPPVTLVAKLLRKFPDAKLGLIAERPKAFGWKTPLRELKGWLTYFPYRSKVKLILSFGEHGRKYYQKIGFDPQVIYPYLYQCPFGCRPPRDSSDSKIRFVYAGQLHPRKGVDLLIKAFGSVNRSNWTLDVYGRGPLESVLRKQVERFGLENKVTFRGVYNSDQVLDVLNQYDVCCVPSRFDAWGLSVNEALQASIPAVVSSSCGSKELIEFSKVGFVFKNKSISELQKSLLSYLDGKTSLFAQKNSAFSYGKSLLEDSVGSYLRDVIVHSFLSPALRPDAPWLKP